MTGTAPPDPQAEERVRATLPHTMSTRGARPLLAGYSVFVAAVLLQPEPRVATSTVGTVGEWLIDRGLPEWVFTSGAVEFTLNVGMFVPFGPLILASFPQRKWWHAVAAGFAGSALAETIQGLFLPGRSAAIDDLVANTLGALIGAAGWALVMQRRDRRRDMHAA